jgi:membrane protein YqaA with SNARE-associated domain
MVIRTLLLSYGLIGLLVVSLISSVVPVPTEPVVFELLHAGENPKILLAVLVIGSIIGALVGYSLGKYGLKKIIPFHNEEREKNAQKYFRRYGTLFLLISPWIPIVGDLAPMVAGIENYESKRFLVIISIAKIIKNVGVVYFSIRAIHWWTLLVR